MHTLSLSLLEPKGRHTEAFALEMGLPFEREDHRIWSLAPEEYMSTLQPTGSIPFGPFRQDTINQNPYLYGAFENGLEQRSSLPL